MTNEPGAFSLALGANDVFYNTGSGQLRRVAKAGGLPQVLFNGAPAFFSGIAVSGNLIFFGLNASQVPGQILQVSATGGQISTFANLSAAVEIDNVVANSGFLYWQDSGSFRRAPVAQPTNVQLLGDGISSNDPFGAVGNCAYAVAFTATFQQQIERVCADGSAVIQYTASSGAALNGAVVDDSGVYFIESGLGIRHIAPTGNTPNAATIVPLVAVDSMMATAIDANFIYYSEGLAGFMDCTTNWSINRVPKSGGPVVPLAKPPVDCPSRLAVDDTFIYYAATGSGREGSTTTIFKLPK